MSGFSSVYEYIYDRQGNITIGDYLRKTHGYSSRVIAMLKREGELLLNGESVAFVAKCNKNDKITVKFPEEAPDADGVDIPFEVIYEDEDLLIADKPAGLVVHRTKSHTEQTLAAAIYYRWQTQAPFIGKTHFVNRLDMDTSGIVVCAKNKYIHHHLQSQSMEGKIDKYYLALTDGAPRDDIAVITEPIRRESEFSIFRVVAPDGDFSQTRYEVLKRYKENALLRLKLDTGRTHQIRVHLKYIGCPITGDSLYNKPSPLIARQALHAASISFIHPRLKTRMEFVSQLPKDFLCALEKAQEL